MGVGFASYEIPKSGLFVNERGLYVTGHNISNVNTPGYVRQQAMITTGPYQHEYGKNGIQYDLGLGADIQQIRQIRHVFLDSMYRQENTTLGYWESRNKTFQDVQSILGEPMGSGLQNVTNQFWDSWQELSKEPDSLTVRALVRQRGEALTHQINHMGEQLDKLQNDLNSEVKVRIDEVNQITGQIANFNIEIMKNEINNDSANDYRDQRNSLVDRLSKLVNADVTEMQDGQLAVTLGGYFLVSKAIQTKLYAGEDQTGGQFVVPKLEGTNTQVPLRSGIIKGLLESRGEVFGATGSSENGSPYTESDITFAIDISNTSAANLTKIQSNIDNYIKQLSTPGVDYNINLMTFDGTTVTTTSYGSDAVAFRAGVLALSATGDGGNNFTNVANALSTLTHRLDANQYALVFTGESIEGDGGTAVTDSTSYTNILKGAGIKTSVITDLNYENSGDSAGEIGWDRITGATGGNIYDINSANFNDVMTRLGMDNVNDGMTAVPQSQNIISDLRKRLNALINTMAREVNNLHKSGNTSGNPPNPGDDFFTAIDSAYPMQMGNIKLNDNLLNLNNIVASTSGASGDNTIALKISNLRHKQIMNDISASLSMDEYYQATILSVGNGGVDAERITDNQLKLVQSADSYRQSITGVSMDEEMTNMMKYKYAYDASSRCFNVIDEMIDTVISRMGTVGR